MPPLQKVSALLRVWIPALQKQLSLMIGSIACSEEKRRGNQYAPEVSAVVLAARRGFLCSQRCLEISRQVRGIKTKVGELCTHQLNRLGAIVVGKGWRDYQQLVRHSARPTAVLLPDMRTPWWLVLVRLDLCRVAAEADADDPCFKRLVNSKQVIQRESETVIQHPVRLPTDRV